MRILLTNDDGIEADGLIRLARAAKEFGEVWVVAPESQRSAASHSVTLRHPVEAWRVDFPVEGVTAYACDGMPADCVRVGVLNIMRGNVDHVFTGINHGYNVASDLQYSATAGAAFEASFQKIHTIAFSEEHCDRHAVTDRYLKEIMGKLLDQPLGPGQIWNVNFPGCELSACKGVLYDCKVSRDEFYTDRYTETEISEGHMSYMVDGQRNYAASEGTDLYAVINDYVSVGIVNNLS
ncbi:MAG: 5'/3'-nucleotidase SurE [Lachnospiraceae bacterium]|nr:5'/3'-nucleotidase SurE [Lachnospiraceae bacterium]